MAPYRAARRAAFVFVVEVAGSVSLGEILGPPERGRNWGGAVYQVEDLRRFVIRERAVTIHRGGPRVVVLNDREVHNHWPGREGST